MENWVILVLHFSIVKILHIKSLVILIFANMKMGNVKLKNVMIILLQLVLIIIE